MLEAKTFIQRLEAYCPKELAEPGDPVGLHIGTLNKSVQKVMMTLDVRPDVVKEAIEKDIDLIVAKHPPIFRPIKRLVTDDFQTKMFEDLLKHDIAVYAAHTNMDIVEPGLNDWFCDMLGVTPVTFLRPTHTLDYKKLVIYTPLDSAEKMRKELALLGVGEYSSKYDSCSFSSIGTGRFRPLAQANPAIGSFNHVEEVQEERMECLFKAHMEEAVIACIHDYHPYEEPVFDILTVDNMKDEYGIGRIGKLEEPMTLMDFVNHVKKTFQLDGLRLITDNTDKLVQTIAICGGSGEKFYKDALSKGADVYITGDVYYHTAHDMVEEKLSVIDPGHYIEEVCKQQFVNMFNDWKEEYKWDVEFLVSETNTNPFMFI